MGGGGGQVRQGEFLMLRVNAVGSAARVPKCTRKCAMCMGRWMIWVGGGGSDPAQRVGLWVGPVVWCAHRQRPFVHPIRNRRSM